MPGATGGIVIQVLTGERADVVATPAAGGVARQSLTGARVTVSGPVTRTVTQTSPSGGFFDITVDSLPPASYAVDVEGLSGTDVVFFGNTTGVSVQAGAIATATVENFESFVPVLEPPASPTTSFAVRVMFSEIPAAAGYIVQSSRSADFAMVTNRSVTTSTAVVPVNDTGTVYLRVRATNARIPAGQPSAVDSFRVVREPGDTSGAPAFPLGFLPTVVISGVNIAPMGDEDWYSFSICDLDTIIVAARAVRLDPPSPLNSFIQLFDSTLTGLDSSSDADSTDDVLLYRMAVAGTYRLRLAAAPGAVGDAAAGHYTLDVRTGRAPQNPPGACK
jgi:hypothetical protein